MPDPEAVATETEAEAQSDKPAQTQSKGETNICPNYYISIFEALAISFITLW